jgi:hypothetical protein
MVTLVGTEGDVGTLLRDLVLRDHDSIAAYEAAIERPDDDGYKRALGTFRDANLSFATAASTSLGSQ